MLYHILTVMAGNDMRGLVVLLGFFQILGLLLLIAIVTFAICAIITIIGLWQIFKKAGHEGWKAIIPFYNLYLLTKISGQEGWLFLLVIIPAGAIVWFIMTCIKLASAFGKNTDFAFGLILLPPVFFCILGFGNAQYQLGGAAPNTQPNGPAPQEPQATQDQGSARS